MITAIPEPSWQQCPASSPRRVTTSEERLPASSTTMTGVAPSDETVIDECRELLQQFHHICSF